MTMTQRELDLDKYDCSLNQVWSKVTQTIGINVDNQTRPNNDNEENYKEDNNNEDNNSEDKDNFARHTWVGKQTCW